MLPDAPLDLVTEEHPVQSRGQSKLSRLSKEVVLLMVVSIVGFGLFQGACLLDMGSGPYSNAPFAVAGIAAGGVAYAAVAIVAWTGRLEKTRGLCIAGIACALAWLLASGGSGPVWACVAQILGGVGWALVNLCWMQLFSLVIPRYAVILIACGYLVDSLLVPACTAWVPDLRHECFYVALAGSWAALAVCLAGSSKLYRAMQDQAIQENVSGSQAPSTQGLRGRMARALMGTAVFSAMCGLVVQVDLFRGVQYAQAPATSLVCAAVAAAMVVALLALRPRGVNVDAIYPLSVAAFASVLLFRVFLPQQANLAGSLMVALLITFFSLLWMGFVSEAHARKLPALFVLGLPVAVAQLSIAAGRSLGYLPAGTFIGSSDARLVAFVLWGLLLSLCLLYGAVLLGRRSPRGQGAPRAQGPTCPPVAQGQQTPHAATQPGTQPSTPASVPAPSRPDALDLLREHFGLSAKEAQTVAEYSSGRSARYLADQAMISEHTVKTYLRRAYAKLGVHSRQELLDLMGELQSGGFSAGSSTADSAAEKPPRS